MKYIKIKDWEKHQHYKDRNPPWIKLHNTLLMDYEFSQLSDASKLQLILLWLLASQTGNKIPADAGWIKNNIKCNGKVDLESLKTLGFIELYQDASGCVQDACLETEGEESREEGETHPVKAGKSTEYTDDFGSFWSAYPRKEDKKSAFASWSAVRKRDISVADMVEGAERYKRFCDAEGREPSKIKHPATWLNNDCWENEYKTKADLPSRRRISDNI